MATLMIQDRTHILALDSLRGIAILMVLATHTNQGWTAALSIHKLMPATVNVFALPGWADMILNGGVHGVTLFFVVSAFTLTKGRGQIIADLWGYAVRRVARVGPGYWLAGLVYTTWAGMDVHGITIRDVFIAVTFGSAWQSGGALFVVPGGWSVSCEVAFYAALPAILLMIGSSAVRAALLTLLAMAAVQLWTRHLATTGQWNYTAYTHPLVQLPVFLCGITAALIRPPPYRIVTACLILAIGGIPFWRIIGSNDWVQSYLLFAVVAAVATATSVQNAPAWLIVPALRRIGEVSYSMYLLHFALLVPSMWIAERAAPAGWPTLAVHMALTTGATVSLACLTHRWVEQPFIRAGRMLLARRAKHQTLLRVEPT